MTQSLDNILSGQQEAAPQEAENVQTEQAQASEQTQEQATKEQSSEGQEDRQKMVPHEALHAEKQKVKRYTEQIASFEQKMQEQDKAWERRFGELINRLPKQQEQPIEWFEDPRGAFRQDFQQSIAPILTPVQQQMQTLQSQFARFQAGQVFGEKLSEFMSYVTEHQSDPDVVALQAAMDRAPDPYAYAKDWFEKKTFDPEAERARIRAELEAELGQQQQTQQTTQVMPSNLAGARNVGTRSGSMWSGPPPLTDIFKR